MGIYFLSALLEIFSTKSQTKIKVKTNIICEYMIRIKCAPHKHNIIIIHSSKIEQDIMWITRLLSE
ncbi:hypothetical protein A2738_03805 [Candidatus Nomurabacteria bacterium RIFCSPHIGHO2_01_FULL_42_15]|uniref:Uncharacterized protein n=1 Tax=Candidatus Nomurabacteria bacterium RIFCSPHIGHO2_01_FULL_42_15 TaxID=1801742 RepID=A0A1F6VEC2_9BACT|nr:MAG: hypothetical protein A2738_03805 [Candidatus Nomurabacteria bacterium RIFCSPHIGHO2_01_FULL_42_15]OGI93328.1 MAG: hypothetical protein A3A99_03660 [Candidatus Nomurabacteria bacterium RIFCSPLOWO2_01_FULL_41_18]